MIYKTLKIAKVRTTGPNLSGKTRCRLVSSSSLGYCLWKGSNARQTYWERASWRLPCHGKDVPPTRIIFGYTSASYSSRARFRFKRMLIGQLKCSRRFNAHPRTTQTLWDILTAIGVFGWLKASRLACSATHEITVHVLSEEYFSLTTISRNSIFQSCRTGPIVTKWWKLCGV